MRELIIVRGGGDIATGTIYKLVQCGFDVLVLEVSQPSAIRRNVAFSEAVYEGSQQVEHLTCRRADSLEQAWNILRKMHLAIMVDEQADCLQTVREQNEWKLVALVDGILAKKNLHTNRNMAPVTVALGPGFIAGVDVDAVIETKRGHSLGRVLYEGSAAANTGIPGMIAGFSSERVIHAPAEGRLKNVCHITDQVKKDEVIAQVLTAYGEEIPVKATLTGLLRGLLRDDYPVTKGFKIADIDPRIEEYDNCFTISDKARCIAGGVVEAILHLRKELEKR